MSTHHEIHRDGFFHSGTGDQHNYFHPVRPRRDPRLVARGQVDWLAARFAPPEGFRSDALERPGVVVLAAAEGAGARTAALMLLTDSGRLGASRLRELSLGDEDGQGLKASDLDAEDRLLLDLTETPEERLRELGGALEHHRALAEEADARLVLVVRDTQVRLLPRSLLPLTTELRPPPARAVLAAHLHPEGIELPRSLPRAQAVYLTQASVHDAGELARLVLAARAAGPGLSLERWLAEAVAAWRQRGEQARALFAEHGGSNERSLLIAAAFLDGAPLAVVSSADAALRHRTEVPAVEEPLHSPYLPDRLAGLGMEERDRAVRFTRPTVGRALREHFWTYFPHLHETALDWVTDVAVRSGPDGVAMAERFTEQALVSAIAPRLTALAAHWGEVRPELAIPVLAGGLADLHLGGEFRKHVYEQAKSHRTSPGHALALVEVCVVEIAPLRPRPALVRLHHLARSTSEVVRAQAGTALRELVRERRLERWLLNRLAREVQQLRVEDAHQLVGLRVPAGSDDDLVEVWRRLFALEVERLPDEVVAEWALREPGVLVRACDLRIGLMDRLYLHVRRRAGGEAAAVLLRHVETALGVTDEGEEA
ncbi:MULTISPECIES: hypothetical protein [Actinosynnema]|uniref:hypothetical protein n=1 Tax=Actinosynnema TaxID=40566 RepID=UPI0020A25362|nr:hypothetical protein [Actinosynnema pretiosum]MCP2096430.1 hypothetical protein [Actinosynnema pretiosum]